MNNKGQSLVIFIVILPILFILLVGIYDLIYFNIKQTKYENISKEVLTNIINNNLTDEEAKELFQKNHINTENLIIIRKEKIVLSNKESIKLVFGNILKDKIVLKVNFEGELKDNKVIIKEVNHG